MLDYPKRDAKIARKLAEIQNAPPDLVEKVTTKALKALFSHGIEQARKEAEWCESCEGRGYRPCTNTSIVDRFGWRTFYHSEAPPKCYKQKFCYCKRGEDLKRIFEVLGDCS